MWSGGCRQYVYVIHRTGRLSPSENLSSFGPLVFRVLDWMDIFMHTHMQTNRKAPL